MNSKTNLSSLTQNSFFNPNLAAATPPIPFALNMRRKLRLPILPYECKCQCNKLYDIYGDHLFNCPKNHKGRPHNMITNNNKFSQALAPLLTTTNIISPTTNLYKETHLHLPADPTARPFNVSYKPNCDCHPLNVFSMIGLISQLPTPLHRLPQTKSYHRL